MMPKDFWRDGINLNIVVLAHFLEKFVPIFFPWGASCFCKIVAVPSLNDCIVVRRLIWFILNRFFWIMRKNLHWLVECDQDILLVMGTEIITPLISGLEPFKEF